MDKRFWGILIAVAIVFIGIFWISSSKKANAPSTSTQPTNHIEGQGKSGVTLVEYGDYECPFCGQFYPTVKQVAAQYSQQIYFQFRNLPLTQIHQNAFASARAAEAAGLQGKFWQMHDGLYSNQSVWAASTSPQTTFDSFAQALGLNITKFRQDFASEQTNNLINADLAAFAKTGEQEATPTFFLDGKKISPNNTVSSFQQLIDAEIAKKSGHPSTSSTTSSTAPASTNQSVQPSTSTKH